MTPLGRGRATAYHVWVKLLVLLALFTLWVDREFVPRLVEKYRGADIAFWEQTRNVAVRFAVLPHRARSDDVLVALVGDSTVGGIRHLAPFLETELARRLPGRTVASST